MPRQRLPWLRLTLEGVVVVGSILLAFAIDAWWDDRQKTQAEIELLVGLTEEVGANLENLGADLDSLKLNRDRLSRFVLSDPATVGESEGDSAWVSVVRPLYRDFSPKLSYGFLDATIAAGKLELIRDVELRAALAGLKRFQDEADGLRGPGMRLADLSAEAGPLVGDQRAVQLGWADVASRSISSSDLQALRSDDRIVALAAARGMLTLGYINQLRKLETELLSLRSLIERQWNLRTQAFSFNKDLLLRYF